MKRGNGLAELDELEKVFRALAHETRRHVLIVLNARGGQMTAGEIAGRFSCAWPTTSRHLRILEQAGLVRMERSGREWLYILDKDRLHGVVGRWLGWFKLDSWEDI